METVELFVAGKGEPLAERSTELPVRPWEAGPFCGY